MIQFQVEGVERAMSNLNLKAQQFHTGVSNIIIQVGDSMATKLQAQFKDVTITGKFFPKNLEYWLGISRIGKKVTWIKCPVSNLFFGKERNVDGSQDIKSNVPTVDIEKISNEILQELTIRIKEMKNIILK